jgi:hypothetical protein
MTSRGEEEAAAWVAAQQPSTVRFPIARAGSLGKMAVSARALLDDMCEEEARLVGLDAAPGLSGPRRRPLSMSESDVPSALQWLDAGEGYALRLVDNFLVVNGEGEAVGLEALDELAAGRGGGGAAPMRLFGTVVEPKPLAEDETPRLWERSEIKPLRRSARLAGVEVLEWALDLTFGDESLWVISKAGVWYKLRGEQGPGSALAPNPLYVAAFAEARRKFEACVLVARLLQQPGAPKRPQLDKVLAEACELSRVSSDAPVDEAFILSRAQFLAGQVESVQNFALPESQAAVGALFSKELLKRQATLVLRHIKDAAKSEALAARRAAAKEGRKRARAAANGEGGGESGGESSDSAGGEEQGEFGKRPKGKVLLRVKVDKSAAAVAAAAYWDAHAAFPMDDTEVLDMMARLQSGELAKPPAVLRRIGDLAAVQSVLQPHPLPPAAPRPLQRWVSLGMCDYTLGSLLGCYESLRVLGDFLRITPFGFEEFLRATVYRPSREAFTAPPSLAQAGSGAPLPAVAPAAMLLPAAAAAAAPSPSASPLAIRETPTFASPLIVEVAMRLIEFILDQPENVALEARILGGAGPELGPPAGKRACATAGVSSLVNRLTWQHVVVLLLSEVEKCALPVELATVSHAAEAAGAGGAAAEVSAGAGVAEEAVEGALAGEGDEAGPAAVSPRAVDGAEGVCKLLRAASASSSAGDRRAAPAMLTAAELAARPARAPRQARKFQEEQDAFEARYPQSVEGHMLVRCRRIVEELMEDPRAGPFRAKVDVEALGIPDYFTIVDKPMDLGTINDRLYAGFYCPEKIGLALGRALGELDNLRAWTKALCSARWKQAWFMEARQLRAQANRGLSALSQAMGGSQPELMRSLNDAIAALDWALERRKADIQERESRRRKVLESAPSRILAFQQALLLQERGQPLDENATASLAETLALQDCVLLPTVTLAGPTLGFTTGDSSDHTTFIKSFDELSIIQQPDLFNVVVMAVLRELAPQTAQQLNMLRPGDRVVGLGSHLLTGLANDQVAHLLKSCQFPLKVTLARKQDNAFGFEGLPLTVPANLRRRRIDKGQQPQPQLLPQLQPQPQLQSPPPPQQQQQQEQQQQQGGPAGDERSGTGRADADLFEDGDDLGPEDVDGHGGGLDAFNADVQLVFLNCFKYNNKRSQIALYAATLKEIFDAEYQTRITDVLERIDSTRSQIKQDAATVARTGAPGHLTVIEAIRFLDGRDVADIPPRVRAWVLEWLCECALQSQAVRTFVETGIAPPELQARVATAPKRGGGRVSSLATAQTAATATAAGEAFDLTQFVQVVASPVTRLEPLGTDRMGSRYWWVDGDTAGRIFVESAVLAADPTEAETDGSAVAAAAAAAAVAPPPSAAEQLDRARRCADAVLHARDTQTPLRWGVLSTREQLDLLVRSLNPLGRNEFELLRALHTVYRRLGARMPQTLAPQAIRPLAPGDGTSNLFYSAPPESTLLLLKIQYGQLALASSKHTKRNAFTPRELGPELPPVQSMSLQSYRVPHMYYSNKVGLAHQASLRTRGSASGIASAIGAAGLGGAAPGDAAGGAPPPRLLMSRLMTPPAHESNRELLVSLLLQLEQSVFESRSPSAMGRSWPWTRARKIWMDQIDELQQLVRREPWDRQRLHGAWRGDDLYLGEDEMEDEMAGARRTFEVRVLADKLLQLEAECISYWCTAGTTSAAGSCVDMYWRLRRDEWRGLVRRARSDALLAVLARRLAVESVRWSETDRSLLVLFGQHSAAIAQTLSQPHAPTGEVRGDPNMVGAFWEPESRGSCDVLFGQVLSCSAALEVFGFVAVGAALSSHLHAVVFGKSAAMLERLPVAFQRAAKEIHPVALMRATGSAVLTLAGQRPPVRYVGRTSSGWPVVRTNSGWPELALDGVSAAPEGPLKKAVVSVMNALSLRQKDVAEQVACSQSHLSLWLNAKDTLDMRKFDYRMLNWLRIKNLVHGWIHEVLAPNGQPYELNAGIEGIPGLPTGLGPEERRQPELKARVYDALFPALKMAFERDARVEEDSQQAPQQLHLQLQLPSQTGQEEHAAAEGWPEQVEVPQAVDVTDAPDCPVRHPYRGLFRSSITLEWSDVVPFRVAPAQARYAGHTVSSYAMWIKAFSQHLHGHSELGAYHYGPLPVLVRQRLDCAALHMVAPGSQVVYWLEGHAFANAHAELRNQAEVSRSGREQSAGVAVAQLVTGASRRPLVCRVAYVSYHLGNGAAAAAGGAGGRRCVDAPYIQLVLEPLGTSSATHVPALDLGLPAEPADDAEAAHAEDDSSGVKPRSLKHLLYPIVVHLLAMPEAAQCYNAVSPAVYRDLDRLVDWDSVVDLATVHQRVLDGQYTSMEQFLGDLASMANFCRHFFVEVHKYGPGVAKAAAAVLMRARLLARHPETLCELADQARAHLPLHDAPPHSQSKITVTVRPALEGALPGYVAAAETVWPSVGHQQDLQGRPIKWRVGMRVRRRGLFGVAAGVLAGQNPARFVGTVVGFRYPLLDMQLPWAAIVVRWDTPPEDHDLDLTLDMPRFAHQLVNAWEISPELT